MSRFDDAFFRQYVETALWSSTDDDGEPMDRYYSALDMPAETTDAMRSDCDDFIDAAGALLDGIDPEQAGHDFWLTRNHHGAGFWDRGTGDIGRKLTDLAHAYGTSDLYVGDDGYIYVTP